MRSTFRCLYMVLTMVFMVSAITPSHARRAKKEPQAKYVFYLIGDGMGINEVTGAELYNQATGNGPQQINFRHFPVSTFVNTFSASSLVTDSAAGGTALSTGTRTYNGAIGVDQDRNPISTIAEWAKDSGAGVGVATSVGINHATPASFYAHVNDRNSYDAISRQLIDSDVDFAAGGGFLTEKKKGLESSFYEQEARGEGIKVFYGVEDFANVSTDYERVICLGGHNIGDLPFAVDRKEGDTALKDFVSTGIDYLYGRYEDEGFFFMIEGGMIDYAGHNDDAVTCFQEVNDFAEAIDVVLAFYNEHPEETLIVVTADHETGGLMLGAGEYIMNPERLAAQKMSENELTAKFRQTYMPPAPPQRRGQRGGPGMSPQQQPQWTPPTWEEVKTFLKDNLGLWDLVPVDKRAEERFHAMYESTFTAKDGENEVRSLYSVNTRLISEAVMYLNAAAGYQWSFGSHSGSPVGLYVNGVRASEFNSCDDNIDIPLLIARIAGYNTNN